MVLFCKYIPSFRHNNQVREKKYALIGINQPRDSPKMALLEASNHKKMNKWKILYSKRSCVGCMMRQYSRPTYKQSKVVIELVQSITCVGTFCRVSLILL